MGLTCGFFRRADNAGGPASEKDVVPALPAGAILKGSRERVAGHPPGSPTIELLPMNNETIWIVGAKRTVQGKLLGGLAGYSAVELAVGAGRAALNGLDRDTVDLAVVGNVLSAGSGMNVARQIGVKLGLGLETPAFTVNMMCASGLQAIALGAQAIRTGEAETVLCGGTESMSNAPYLLERARGGYQLGHGKLVDSVLRDGLVDSFDGEHMGMTAERLAEHYGLTREEQDNYAAASQRRYAAARERSGFEDEVVPVGEVRFDEHPRPGTTAEDLARLKPVFKETGTVTAGNASGVNDGAAMLVLCREATGRANGWEPMARVVAWTVLGCDPSMMGLGPAYAIRRLLDKTGCAIGEFDTVELNEAFAGQTLACLRELGLSPDDERVNPDGGAIALGHPIGASGARLATHLACRIARGDTGKGIASLCVGGGMGMAMILEKAVG